MSDLSSMIDDTTEKLLRKIDNWEIPQLDKKYLTIEKEVWESTLNCSMVLEAENKQLKELLKECKRQFEEVELCRYDVADTDQKDWFKISTEQASKDWFKISTEQASIANEIIIKINQVLGDKDNV